MASMTTDDPRRDDAIREQVRALLAQDPRPSVRAVAAQIGRSVSRTHALIREVEGDARA